MDVYQRYFRIKSGPLVDAVIEANQINADAVIEYQKILKEIGARPEFYHCGGRLVGVNFESRPHSGLFKRQTFGWYPKKNCRVGKELAAKIEAVKTKNPKMALKLVGLSDHPTLFGAGRCYSPSMTVIPEKPPVIYISVPWYDEDPDKIEQYKKDHEAGIRSDLNFESILWEPTSEMQEVKRWEVDRHVDEWNEKVRAKEKGSK